MNRILLLCQQYGCPIELSPARYQLIHELYKKQYEIYVFYPGSILNKKIKGEIHHFTNTLGLSTKTIRKKIRMIAPEYVIGFTYEDTKILFQLPDIMRKTVFVYYNLEIYTPQMEQYIQTEGKYFLIRCYSKYFVNKLKEIHFTRRCKLFVIQDDLRRRTSIKYFIYNSNTLLIPNSYTYCEQRNAKGLRNGIIYSGGLNKLQLESMFQKMDNIPDVPLTFSGWSDSWFQLQYKKLRKTHCNIQFHNQKLSPEMFSKYLDQYAVGLIWYSPIKDENINNIGLASGKLFRYLSMGQPVIVVDSPGISEVIRRYKLGVVIHDVIELKEAYEHIMRNYDFYCKNIDFVYKKKFDYKKRIKPFLKKLREL